MPDSVGAISLDLVIKNKVGDQLEGLQSSLSRSAAKLGEAIENAIENPMKKISDTAADAVSDAMDRIEDSLDNGITDAIAQCIQRAEQQKEELLNAVNSVQTISSSVIKNRKAYGYDPEAMKFMEEFEKKGSKAAETINQRMSETVESIKEKLSSFEVSSDPVERMQQELDHVSEKMALLQKKWQELSSAEPTDKIRSQLNGVESQIISTQNAIDKLTAKMGRSSGVDKLTQTIEKYNAKIKAIEEQNAAKLEQITAKTALMKEKYEQQILSMKKKYADRIQAIEKRNSESSEKSAAKSSDATKKSFSIAFGSAKKMALQAGVKAVGAVTGKLKELGKKALGLLSPIAKLGNALKNTFKRVFPVSGIYAAFRAIKDGLLEAVKADEEFSRSLNEVKANLSIAFTPIVQSVMPTLNTLMSGLASLARNIAGFIAGLFGMTYKQAADATKKLRGVTDEAKKAKLSTAGIDEMNILSDSKDTSSGSDSGIDYSNIDMSEPELPDWAERLKTAIKSGDWAGVGAILAERVNNAFGSVNWDNISSKVNSGVRKVTDGINGFLDNIDWGTLGDTLAGGINTITGAINTFYSKVKWDKLGSGIATGLNRAINKIKWNQLGKAFSGHLQALIETLYSFVTTFDWSNFGKSIGKAVNGWFEGIDFGKAGKTISEGIKGLLDFLINFVRTVDWQQIGEKIAEFFSNIDYAGIASKVFELLGSALGAGISLLWGAVKDLVSSAQQFFMDEFDRMDTGNIGLDIILGILVGIGDAIIGIGKWIYNNVFMPFINGFKEAFDIHSPSKVMEEMGGFIIDGLYKAIAAGISTIKKIFEKMREKIKEVFSKIHEWFEDKFSEAYKLIQNVFSGIGKWFENRWNDVKSAFSEVADWFKEKFQTAWDNITAVFTIIGSWFENRWNDVKSVFSIVGDWFGEKFETAWDRIKKAFKDVWNFFNDKWENIKSIFSDVGDWFGDKFSCAFDSIKNAFSDVGNFFYGIWEDVSDKAKDGMNWLMGRIEDGLNRVVDGLNWFGFDLPDVMGGGHVGFDLSYVNLPRLANGGLATAPTLAMVGDNRNARTDPEVIAPLSKLEGMMGNTEIVELLRIIVELLRSGMNIEVINYLFKGQKEFSREVLKVTREDAIRRG